VYRIDIEHTSVELVHTCPAIYLLAWQLYNQNAINAGNVRGNTAHIMDTVRLTLAKNYFTKTSISFDYYAKVTGEFQKLLSHFSTDTHPPTSILQYLSVPVCTLLPASSLCHGYTFSAGSAWLCTWPLSAPLPATQAQLQHTWWSLDREEDDVR